MKIPANKTLMKIAVFGGFGSITAVMWMRYKIEDRIRNADYYRLAFQTLRKHKGAVSLLGEPIKDGGFELSNSEKNFCDGEKAKFQVKVRGSKDKGTLFFWATRNQKEGWILNQMELELKGQPDERYLLKKLDAETQQLNPTGKTFEWMK